MSLVSETTWEHDDSEYDHWELIMFLPQRLSREEIKTMVQQIISNQKIVTALREWIQKKRKIESNQTISLGDYTIDLANRVSKIQVNEIESILEKGEKK